MNMFVRVLSKLSWAGVTSTASVFIYNSTEHWRMARNIKLGKLFSPQKESLDDSFCQFPIPDIKVAVQGAPDQFCGLVGLKSTGKTSTLELVAKDLPNVVYVEMEKSDDVCDVLHEKLKNSVYHLPWFLDRIRLDSSLTSKAIVTKVFRDVRMTSGTRVTTVIDVNPTKPLIIPNQVLSLSSPGVFERVTRDLKSLAPSFSFDTILFTRQVKQLVDSGVMQCLFAATEGVNFQIEAVYEPRLRLFVASELPISMSVNYLQKRFNVTLNKEGIDQLYHLPRTFTNLQIFATQVDRKEFVDNNFKNEMLKIKKTLGTTKANELYGIALKKEFTFDDLLYLGLSEDEFIKVFVVPNIFTITLHQSYKFQFDATSAAAKQVYLDKPKTKQDETK